jgi:hypothetical protein
MERRPKGGHVIKGTATRAPYYSESEMNKRFITGLTASQMFSVGLFTREIQKK